jgi:hypothetical protein
MHRPLIALLLAVPLAAQQPTQSGAPTAAKVGGAVVPTWVTMETLIRKEWAERYPRESIALIEKIGEPKFTDEPGKVETTSSSASSSVWDWSWNETSWSTTTKGREGAFLRQTMIVTAERPNKTRAKFTVAALYKLTGTTWQFVEMPVGKVEEIAGAGAPVQPSDAEAAKLFRDAWTANRPDFTTDAVKINAREFHQSGGRVWITFKLAIDATGTEKGPAAFKGKRVVCEPADYSSQLKWDKDAAKWVADANSISMVNETSACREP